MSQSRVAPFPPFRAFDTAEQQRVADAPGKHQEPEVKSTPPPPAKEADPLHTRQWLFHIIEVETDVEHCLQSVEKHEVGLRKIIADKGNPLKEGNVGVHVTTLPKDTPFDFDSVHHLPAAPIVEKYGLVLEAIYREDTKSKCFVRVKVDLTAYDGVTALHAGFNLLEYLEHGDISAYPFTSSNTLPPPDVQMDNFTRQMKRIVSAKKAIESDPLHNRQGVWQRSPLMYELEDNFDSRKGRRFTNVNLTFKETMQRLDQVKQALGIDLYATTVNFSPDAVVSLCPTIEDVLDKETKLANISFPPAGTGPPPPMNNDHVGALFNTIFLNNYGRHEPRISGTVVGYMWDWSGLFKTFPPVVHVSTIQGKLFLSMSASPPDMAEMEKIFNDKVGESHSFTGLPFHQVKSSTV
mmetsp:Transcript_18296/g.34959  ORF Transcript_18296/g.34959 Transcript_18296/m.34959 type:complete len:408 (+) Transcript_18296:96-1319(+)|eukprot:scaffold6781_cov204-Amphora_coffeaeformis.AAC.31